MQSQIRAEISIIIIKSKLICQIEHVRDDRKDTCTSWYLIVIYVISVVLNGEHNTLCSTVVPLQHEDVGVSVVHVSLQYYLLYFSKNSTLRSQWILSIWE